MQCCDRSLVRYTLKPLCLVHVRGDPSFGLLIEGYTLKPWFAVDVRGDHSFDPVCLYTPQSSFFELILKQISNRNFEAKAPKGKAIRADIKTNLEQKL